MLHLVSDTRESHQEMKRYVFTQFTSQFNTGHPQLRIYIDVICSNNMEQGVGLLCYDGRYLGFFQ